ncbi:GerAB/ArcD/ProY family transporter [Ammoniphilus sp. 3BR4]
MIENGKISSVQMAMIMFNKVLATVILVVPTITARHAGRDMWISPIIILFPDIEPTFMFPIMENGIMPSLKGAISPAAWFTHFALISFLLPFLTDREKGLIGRQEVFYG